MAVISDNFIRMNPDDDALFLPMDPDTVRQSPLSAKEMAYASFTEASEGTTVNIRATVKHDNLLVRIQAPVDVYVTARSYPYFKLPSNDLFMKM